MGRPSSLFFGTVALCITSLHVLAEDVTLHYVNAPGLNCDSQTEVEVEVQAAAVEQNVNYTVAFFRTSPQQVSVRFRISSASGPVMQWATVHLAQQTGERRLQDEESASASIVQGRKEEEENAHTCEDFFLADGREPIGLPDTWAEGREAFRRVCEEMLEDSYGVSSPSALCRQSEEATFHGYPHGREALAVDDELCVRLLRLSFRWATGADFEGVGLPPWAMPRRLKGYAYGGGYRSSPAGRNVPYGYSGRVSSGNRRYRVFFFPVGGRMYSSGGRTGGCRQTEAEGDSCEYELGSAEEMYRDDYLDFNVSFANHAPPYTFHFSAVDGTDFTKSGVCPPGRDDPAEHQDIFVALQPTEVPGSPWWFSLIIVAGSCIFVGSAGCVVYRVIKKKKTQEGSGTSSAKGAANVMGNSRM